MSETVFGIWAGTSVHNTHKTIGTGYIFGELAGQVATIVKFTRNMFMIVVTVLISIIFSAKETAHKHLRSLPSLQSMVFLLQKTLIHLKRSGNSLL